MRVVFLTGLPIIGSIHIRVVLIIMYIISILAYFFIFFKIRFRAFQATKNKVDTEYSYTQRRKALLRFYFSALGFLLLFSPLSGAVIFYYVFGPLFIILIIFLIRFMEDWKNQGYSLVVYWGGIFLTLAVSLLLGQKIKAVLHTFL